MTRPDMPEAWRWHAENSRPRHLERLAVVYVRPSMRRQDRLVRRAVALGGAEARGLVIAEARGRSGPRRAGRHGCQRLVAEGGLDHGGLRCGVERSRLARSSTDGPPRLESWARCGTLIADLDGLDEPSPDTDLGLLGWQGTMREAESHLRQPRRPQG